MVSEATIEQLAFGGFNRIYRDPRRLPNHYQKASVLARKTKQKTKKMSMAMARFITRPLLTTTKRSLGPAFRRSYTSLSLFNSRSPPVPTNICLLHLCYPTAASLRLLTAAHSTAVRAFATMQISSSLNDPIPNLSKQPLEETILEDDKKDVKGWAIFVDEPEGNPTRREIIQSYVETLAAVVGSEEEARKKMYVISTVHYFAFGAFISKEIADKIRDLPRVREVGPDPVDRCRSIIVMKQPETNLTRDEIIDMYVKTLAEVVGSEEEARMKIFFVSTRGYLGFGAFVSTEIEKKLIQLHRVHIVGSHSCMQYLYCGGEPFINGQAVPYDPKYHEAWFSNKLRILEEEESGSEGEEEESGSEGEEEESGPCNFGGSEGETGIAMGLPILAA